jgi:two-component system, sensor histidine kinase and response regulator
MDDATRTRLLVVDDEAKHLGSLCAALREEGYDPCGFTAPAEALAALRDARFELILMGLKMPDMDGIALLRAAREIDPDIVGIAMASHGSIGSAIEAMKAGVHDFISKPFQLDVSLPVISRALEMRRVLIENEQLVRSVKKQAMELETTNKELESFAYSVSHDLKGPLRAISDFSQLLMEEYAGKLDESGRRYLEYIRGETMRLSQILEDLVALARINRAVFKRGPLHLTAMAEAVVVDLRRRQPELRCRFEIAEGLEAQGDVRLMTVVLENLLGNACKFSSENAGPRAAMDSMRIGDELVFYIRDNGVGFDMQYADKLFTPFQRQHSQDRFEGNGIGLSIVRRIILRHGGRIWVEAEPDKGATFYFTLCPD